jgi:allophanate hydrolase
VGGVRALAAAHREGRVDVRDTVEAVIAACAAAGDPAIWIHRVPARRLRALAAELAERSTEALPLLGVPFAVKDNIDVAGLTTTAGCPDFAFVAQETAPVVEVLLEAGAIQIGKTNLDQFATGLVGTRTPYGACASVFDASRVSGGSSSGSAVAVAAGLVAFALGTDTAGSGRIPAAFNELVGLKPTRGLLSTRGVVPACRTLDCVSIFARDAADAAEVLEIAAAYDPADPFSRRRPAPTAGRASTDASSPGRPLVLGLPSPASLHPFGDAAAQRAWLQARERAEALADEVIEVDLEPLLEAATLLYDGPWLAERHAAVGAFLEREDVSADPTVRAVIRGGARFTAVEAFAGQYRLAALSRHAEEVFAPLDALMVPTAPTFPTHAEVAAEPVAANARLGTYTNFVNLLDLAAIAIPAARRDDGLPFGVTFVAPAFADEALLELAAAWAGEASHRAGPLRSPTVATGEPSLDLAVAGAHLSGMPRHGELLALDAQLVRTTRTAPRYRLYDLADGTGRPGLLRVGSGEEGEHIEVEVWRLGHAATGAFLATVAAPLAIGSLELEDGAVVHGFLCEPHAVTGARDVTEHGGWRAYTAATAVPA